MARWIDDDIYADGFNRILEFAVGAFVERRQQGGSRECARIVAAGEKTRTR